MMRIPLQFLVTLALAVSSYARTNIAPSIEWLADQSDAVGIYTVSTVHIKIAPEGDDPSNHHWGHWGQANLELDLTDVKKGHPPSKLKSVYNLHPTNSTADIRREINPGHKVLCFLGPSADLPEPVILYSVNLDHPASHGPHAPFSASFVVLHSRDEVVSILDARLKSAVPTDLTDERQHMIQIPLGTPAFQVLFGGSLCYLVVPDDLRPK